MTEISNREKALAYGVEMAKARPDTSPILWASEFLPFLDPQPPTGDVPATTPAGEPAKRRGRPSKAEQPTPPTETASETGPATTAPAAGATIADFLEEASAAAPAREYTKDEVRNGLVAYGNLTNQAKAREVMETHGKSVTVSGIAKDRYATVVDETKKAYLAVGGKTDWAEVLKGKVEPPK
jgi:hypothetical protein